MTSRIPFACVVILGVVGRSGAQPPLPAAAEPTGAPAAAVPAAVGKAPANPAAAVEQPPAGKAPASAAPMKEETGAEKTPAAAPAAEPSLFDKALSVLPSMNGGPMGDCSERWWSNADYLLGWTRAKSLPPLVTTSPPGTAQTAAGVLEQPNTSVLFGNDSNANGDLRSGFRLGLGAWIDSEHTLGVDAGFFMLESLNTLFFATSQGNPILARPFLNAATNVASSQLIAFPGLDTGSVNGSDRSNNLYSGHLDFQEVVIAERGFRLEGLLGYRFLRFDDRLAMQGNLVAGSGAFPAGTQIQTLDNFSAQNEFHGGDFGVRAEFMGRRWSLELLGKLAVGNLERAISINGTTVVTAPGSTPVIHDGGFLALSSNIGSHNSDDWIVIPEFATTLGWDVTTNLRLRFGYSFMFLSGFANAADQVNLNINPGLFPTAQTASTSPNSPTFELHKSYLWVQTLNLGMEFRF